MTTLIAKFSFKMRSGVGGETTDIRIFPEEEVTVLSEQTDDAGVAWVEIQRNGSVGWTRRDNLRETALFRTVTEAELAAICVKVARDLDTNAGYLLAVAHVESRDEWKDGVVTASVDGSGAIAPFRFTKDTWTPLADSARGGEIGLRSDGITFPAQQCVAEGLRSRQNAAALAQKLPRFVTSLDLYLSTLFGVDGAVALVAPAAQEKTLGELAGSTLGLGAAALNSLIAHRGRLTKSLGAGVDVATFLDQCRTALQVGLDKARELLRDLPHAAPPEADSAFTNIPADFDGVSVKIEEEDIDALGRLCEGEVGIFRTFGQQSLEEGIGAVVDTVINRIVDSSGEFENAIQAVIDEPVQFSPILETPSRTWRELPRNDDTSALVDAYLNQRAAGAASKIKGAMHFFNPNASSPSWGPHVQQNPTLVTGNAETDFVHFHGFPLRSDGTSYKAPGSYAILYKGRAHAFAGNGTPLAALPVATAEDDIVKLLREQIAAGKIKFQSPQGKFKAMLLGKPEGGISVTARLQRLVFHLATIADTFIEVSSVIRPGSAGSLHKAGRAIDIGNENIAPSLLPKVAIQAVVDQFGIDEIIFDARKMGDDDENRFNFNEGRSHRFGANTINQHGDHIHFAVKA